MSAVSLQQPDIKMPQVQPDIGTAEAWARHQRKMRTQEKVAEITKIMRGAGRSVWCKLIRRGHEWITQIGKLRDGVRVA